MDFVDYKTEYFLKTSTEERKLELIPLMQKALMEKYGNKSNTINCIDGIERSFTSNDVTDLLAIYAKLMYDEKSCEVSDIGDKKRRNADKNNKYGPSHPYIAN